MNLIWGAILTVFSLWVWLGQTISVLFPQLAVKLGPVAILLTIEVGEQADSILGTVLIDRSSRIGTDD